MPKLLTEDILTGDSLYQWTIQEYYQYKRGVVWYIFMISVGMSLVVYGLMSNNFLFSLIVILAAIILFIQSHQSPSQILFQITELGIAVGNKFYSYSELKSFYIIYQPPEIKSLFIESKNALRPVMNIPLLDVDPVEARDVLLRFLEEDLDKEEEPRSETVARRWKIN